MARASCALLQLLWVPSSVQSGRERPVGPAPHAGVGGRGHAHGRRHRRDARKVDASAAADAARRGIGRAEKVAGS
eukprot:354765-Chlamydomonas_euryale.AAC.1